MSEYPTDEELETIKNWPCDKGHTDFKELMGYVKDIWWQAEWGWNEAEIVDDFGRAYINYDVSTGGWSGNEDIIGAMRKNMMFWLMCWEQSRRGGHYIFRVKGK
jgi:hypothetical protein